MHSLLSNLQENHSIDSDEEDEDDVKEEEFEKMTEEDVEGKDVPKLMTKILHTCLVYIFTRKIICLI